MFMINILHEPGCTMIFNRSTCGCSCSCRIVSTNNLSGRWVGQTGSSVKVFYELKKRELPFKNLKFGAVGILGFHMVVGVLLPKNGESHGVGDVGFRAGFKVLVHLLNFWRCRFKHLASGR